MEHYEMLRRALTAKVAEVLPDPTPLDPAPLLSSRLGVEVLLKREDLTPIFSFKLRGAYNRIALLAAERKARGVIAASAGNHAQGVAYAARKLNLRARVVMPRTTPPIKVAAVRRHGAEIDLVGDDYSEAAAHCAELARDEGMTMVPAYDDLDVIAGQATIALELLRQAPPNVASIFVPIGGGGLAAGIAAVIKSVRPELAVIGVEPDDSDAMAQSIAAGKRVVLEHVGIFADGVAVRQVGEHSFALCRRYLDDCVTVGVDEICAAIKDVFEETRSILEPAGALGVAGIKRMANRGRLNGGAMVAIASGANINFDRLSFVAERAEVGEHREALLAVTIPERRGSFLEFCMAIGDRNISEFNYRLSSPSEAHVFVGVAIGGPAENEEIRAQLEGRGYRCHDLTANDLAKTHVRHLIGGRAEVADEVLYSFEFPERPGALLKFLSKLGNRWNISLFHYRRGGGSFGRVLCGFQVPPGQRAELAASLGELGFDFRDETGNPAVGYFLR